MTDDVTSGWDWRKLNTLGPAAGSFVGGVFLVNPGWGKVTCGGWRGSNTWREWNGGIGKFGDDEDWWMWAQACRNCDEPIPSQMQ